MKRVFVILATGYWLLAPLGAGLATVASATTNDFYADCDIGPDAALIGTTTTWYRVWGSFNNQTTNTAYNIFTPTTSSRPASTAARSTAPSPTTGPSAPSASTAAP
jgi:hypothetical protein